MSPQDRLAYSDSNIGRVNALALILENYEETCAAEDYLVEMDLDEALLILNAANWDLCDIDRLNDYLVMRVALIKSDDINAYWAEDILFAADTMRHCKFLSESQHYRTRIPILLHVYAIARLGVAVEDGADLKDYVLHKFNVPNLLVRLRESMDRYIKDQDECETLADPSPIEAENKEQELRANHRDRDYISHAGSEEIELDEIETKKLYKLVWGTEWPADIFRDFARQRVIVAHERLEAKVECIQKRLENLESKLGNRNGNGGGDVKALAPPPSTFPPYPNIAEFQYKLPGSLDPKGGDKISITTQPQRRTVKSVFSIPDSGSAGGSKTPVDPVTKKDPISRSPFGRPIPESSSKSSTPVSFAAKEAPIFNNPNGPPSNGSGSRSAFAGGRGLFGPILPPLPLGYRNPNPNETPTIFFAGTCNTGTSSCTINTDSSHENSNDKKHGLDEFGINSDLRPPPALRRNHDASAGRIGEDWYPSKTSAKANVNTLTDPNANTNNNSKAGTTVAMQRDYYKYGDVPEEDDYEDYEDRMDKDEATFAQLSPSHNYGNNRPPLPRHYPFSRF
ncbi:hypothetical protein AAE478_001266 [Parahypoxylon ruwenzoriense]